MRTAIDEALEQLSQREKELRNLEAAHAEELSNEREEREKARGEALGKLYSESAEVLKISFSGFSNPNQICFLFSVF